LQKIFKKVIARMNFLTVRYSGHRHDRASNLEDSINSSPKLISSLVGQDRQFQPKFRRRFGQFLQGADHRQREPMKRGWTYAR
jgi:hypothetical protein